MNLFSFTSTSTSILPLLVYERGFFPFVESCSNLFKDYFEHLPANEKNSARQLFITFQRQLDEKYNDEHRKALETKERTILQQHGRMPTKQLSRLLYEHEKELLAKELQERFGEINTSRFSLKSDPTTFTPDRWLKAILTIKSVDVLLQQERICKDEAERQLYVATKRKIEQLGGEQIFPLHLPGFFASDAEKNRYLLLLDKEAQEMKRLQEQQTESILHEENDFAMIHSNIGNGQLGGGRTPYAYFSEQAILYLTNTAESIQKSRQLVPGQFLKSKNTLEKMSEQERLILQTHAGVDAYSGFQWLRTSAMEKIRKYLIEKNVPKEIPQPTNQVPDETVKKAFLAMKERVSEIKLGDQANRLKQMDESEIDLLNTFSAGFLKEIPRALAPLKDFIVLVGIHLAKDFTKETRAPKAERSSILEGAEYRPRNGSGLYSTPRGSFIEEKRAYTSRLQNYVEVFEVAVNILEKIEKLGK